ncbi:MAG: acyltransferase family protein [Bradyrhizobium sp.]
MEPSDHTGNGKSGWKQLDSARLLLALTVVVSHANYVFLTPLGYTAALPAMEWMARYAVLGFFVLSGLVIGRSLAVRRDGFVPFMIRRVGRIYPPLLVSFLLVVAVDRALHLAGISTEALPNAGPMVNSFSYDLQRAALCLATFGFRGWLSSEANAALWSLVIEMRCYVVAGLLAQVAFARTWLGKAACILALAYVLFLLADDGADSVIVISYAAFLFGLLLSLVVRRIPQMIPAIDTDISYSLYIFHSPIMLGLYFAFYQPSFPALGGALALGGIAIVAALGLSLFSARFVEPFRGRALASAYERLLAAAQGQPVGGSSF